MPKRPGSIAGDADRAYAGRDYRRTPGGGVPVEVDPEETPAPHLPPLPPAPDHEANTTARVARLEIGMERFEDGFGKLWEARHTAERIDDLTATLARLESMLVDFVKPTVTAVKAEIEAINRIAERHLARQDLFWEEQWPTHMDSVKGMGERLGRVERLQEDQGREIKAIGAQVSAALAVGNSLDVRVTAIEQKLRDAAALVVSGQALKARDRWWLGGLITIGGAVGAAAIKLYDWLKH